MLCGVNLVHLSDNKMYQKHKEYACFDKFYFTQPNRSHNASFIFILYSNHMLFPCLFYNSAFTAELFNEKLYGQL